MLIGRLNESGSHGFLYSGRTPAIWLGASGCFCCGSSARKLNSFFGTTAGGASIATNSQFDPATSAWTAKTAGTNPQYARVSGSFLDGTVYLASGTYFASGAWQCDTDKFVDSTNSWTALTAVPSPKRWRSSAAAITRLYLFSGQDISGNSIAEVSEYDRSVNSWSGKAALPGGGRSLTVAITDGTLANCVGGINQIAGSGSATYSAANSQFNRSANSWATKTALSNPLFQAGGFSIGSKGYTVGGVRLIGGSFTRDAHFQEYDFPADSWSVYPTSPFFSSAQYPIQNESMGTTSDPSTNMGATIGGDNSGTRVLNHYQFSPFIWSTKTPLPSQPRSLNTGGTC